MNKKELIESIMLDLKELKIDDGLRTEEDKLDRVEQSNFDGRDNAIFDLGMRMAYENALNRINKIKEC